MSNRRYDLPPLAFIQGFEAAARTLSFTRAAAELFVTQSAISRQIKALEANLGVALFERRHRALVLTEAGRRLHAMAGAVLDQVQETTARLRADGRAQTVSLTTTTGFAALWLIPRLRRFTASHPAIDVRISATDTTVNLERDLVDLAIRYCAPQAAPPHAMPLFGEQILPVCSPALRDDPATPLSVPADLRRHVLLHLETHAMAGTWMEWGSWLTSLGIADLKPAGALRFSQYDQMIQAAITGQGVALGRLPLIGELLRAGTLVAPFTGSEAATRGYVILTAGHAAGKAHVAQFRAWLLDEAAAA
ncbi:MAG: transcriptional regulator GcvA [Rhodospirillales bacterium]|nr:transcriptional regulator GcvA [Rhodospirillales bacterium]MDE2576709.1 transcriptional regulator GcvA [Rhodospirillales bacterium]